jgi:ABC-2 type transport system permease protein
MFRRIFSKQNRALLSELVRTDFKLRYQGSVLGYAWSLLRPLFLFTILYLVFIKFLKVNYGVPHSAVYLLVGIVLWNFFLELTSGSTGAIVGRGDLIRKIRIPRWLIIVASSLSAMISLLLNFIVIAVFMILNHVAVSASILWFPLIIVELYIFGIGIAFFLSAAFVKYRDITYIWEISCQALFYLTPLLYPVAKLHWPIVREILFSSPLSQTIQSARYSLVTKETYTVSQAFHSHVWLTAIPFIITILVFIFGVGYFREKSKTFAEDI